MLCLGMPFDFDRNRKVSRYFPISNPGLHHPPLTTIHLQDSIASSQITSWSINIDNHVQPVGRSSGPKVVVCSCIAFKELELRV